MSFRTWRFSELGGTGQIRLRDCDGLHGLYCGPRSGDRKILSLTANTAFFSFPLNGGLLAWQRKLRYRRRCALYMYLKIG